MSSENLWVLALPAALLFGLAAIIGECLVWEMAPPS